MGDWHRREITDVVSELRTDPGSGLTGAEAASRLRAGGPNELPEGSPLRPGRIFLSRFASTMVAVLLGAAAISALLGDLVDTAAIVALIFGMGAVAGGGPRAPATDRGVRPPLRGIFRTVPLPPGTLALCAAASAALFIALEGGKYVFGLARGGGSDYYGNFVRGARAATPVNPGKGVPR